MNFQAVRAFISFEKSEKSYHTRYLFIYSKFHENIYTYRGTVQQLYIHIFAVQYPNRGEDQYRPSLLSNPLIHVYSGVSLGF